MMLMRLLIRLRKIAESGRERSVSLSVLRWLHRNPQHSIPVGLLALYFSVWLVVPRHKPHIATVPLTLAAPSPIPFVRLPSNPLFKRAVKIINADAYWDWEGGFNGYGWLSNHEFLYQDYTEGGMERVQSCRLFRYDIRTHTRRELKGLTKLVSCFYHSQMEISPDGKWMLWHGGTDGKDTIDAATIDGRRHLQWPCGYYTRDVLNWTVDSRHWVDFHKKDTDDNFPSEAHIHDVNARQKDTVLPIATGSLGDEYDARIQKTIVTLSSPNFEAVTPQLQVTEAQIGSRVTPIHQYTIRPPASMASLPNVDIMDGLLSPSGDRIALLISYDAPPEKGKPEQGISGLWICRKDGSDMRNLGDWSQDSNPNHIPELEGLRWLPDGRRLSFVYNNALWTVQVK